MTDDDEVRMMAKALRKAYDGGGVDAMKATFKEHIRLHGRDIALAAFDRLIAEHKFEHEETMAKYEAEQRIYEVAIWLLKASGAPTLGEAARIMAVRGHPHARHLHAHFESCEYRLKSALFDAAVDLHPGWRFDGMSTKLADDAPEETALIEWLYKNHPARAREIEAAHPAKP